MGTERSKSKELVNKFKLIAQIHHIGLALLQLALIKDSKEFDKQFNTSYNVGIANQTKVHLN